MLQLYVYLLVSVMTCLSARFETKAYPMIHTMPKLLIMALVSFGVMLASTQLYAKDPRPNVLLIIVDDLNTTVSAYGHDYMVTPNLDRLADDGVLFERAYTQQPVCSASRASFLTGLRPGSAGVNYPYSEYFVHEVLPRFPYGIGLLQVPRILRPTLR